jgi:hypothetical protein
MKKIFLPILFVIFLLAFITPPASAAGTGTALLGWDAVTTNSDGTPCTDLAGYKIYYGTVSRGAATSPAQFAYQQSVSVGNVLGYTVTGLADGTWYFSVTAFDTLGNESNFSNEVHKIIDTTIPTIAVSGPSAAMTASGPITFTVTYAGADTITLGAADVTLNKSGTANGTVAVSGSGSATRTITISGITGNGTIGISIAAGTGSDAGGNKTAATGPSSVFTVDNLAPAPPQNLSAPDNFTITSL